MTLPLSPVREASLNRATPPSKRKYDQYEVHAIPATNTTPVNETIRDYDSPRSSPFVSKVDETADLSQENMSPAKARHSRVISGTEPSPLRLLEVQRNGPGGRADMAPPVQRSPRRLHSPESRFPVKVDSSPRDENARMAKERKLSREHVVRGGEGLETPVGIFEDDTSGLAEEGEGVITERQQQQQEQHQQQRQKQQNGQDDQQHHQQQQQQQRQQQDGQDDQQHHQQNDQQTENEYDESACPDDSMISTFSTFSVVPNLTVFANLRKQSPTKNSSMEGTTTPRAKLRQHDTLARPSSSSGSHGNTSNLLMDFTDQMRFPHKPPGKRGNLSPSRITDHLATTPNRPVASLIDFDIPPMPTPRSLPSITSRELESLKSTFLSEISSLKASLSGKEAEVHSLKTAVGDAETRVGESLEQLREERALKEQLAAEKEDLEKRGQDMEGVIRKMREEMRTSQRDRDELDQKLEESEKRREAAEILHQEAESKMAGMRAGKECGGGSSSGDKSSKDAPVPPSPAAAAAAAASNKEVEMAVERVARELHALYKGKHETKVAALKKSYETRWERRVQELENRIQDLATENENLRDREMNTTRLDPDATMAEERVAQAAKDGAAIRELNADVQRLEAIVSTVKRDNKELRTMLERERVEKGELVQLAEEMMSMQAMTAAGPDAASGYNSGYNSGSGSGSGSSHDHASDSGTVSGPFHGSAATARAELRTPAATRLYDRQERDAPLTSELGAKTPRLSGETRNSAIGRSAVSGLRAPGSVVRPPQGHIRRASGGLPRPGRSGVPMSLVDKTGLYKGKGHE
ncbi:hypothetical protein E4U17_006694 [Claviceps sp. LM77 group G4]|nr:hypothetical protein E4U17_006694 [Claviceps sp. LM77 group G4]KAG6080076.1 hypothetical protein E4U33_007918 [Claviceps sp. LM78 group G4]